MTDDQLATIQARMWAIPTGPGLDLAQELYDEVVRLAEIRDRLIKEFRAVRGDTVVGVTVHAVAELLEANR